MPCLPLRSAVWNLTVMTALLGASFISGVRGTYAQSKSESEEISRDQLYEEIEAEVAFLERQGNLLKKVVRVIRPTIVHIEAKKPGDGRSRRSVEEAGSGVVITANDAFYVLTNRHVVHNAPLKDIDLELADGRSFHPQQAWTDEATDIAILHIAADGLTPARLGDSDQLEIGDFVLAVGSPFGLSHSVTQGIVSAKGRRDLQLGSSGVKYQDFIQTDAAINPGNSGGPLINLRGEVVGINTAIASNSGGNEGIGFSIPINMAMFVAQQLVERGNVIRAFLGVVLDSQFNLSQAQKLGLPRLVGARVNGITPNSAAKAANVKIGDIILQFDGVRIDDDNHLINQVSVTPIGKQVDILVFREGASLDLTVTVGTRKQEPMPR